MKRFLLAFAFAGMLLGFSGCDKKGSLEGGGTLHCWEFTVTIKYTGTGSELFDDVTNIYEQCNINESQAEYIRKAHESTTTVGGMTVTTTATKKKKD